MKQGKSDVDHLGGWEWSHTRRVVSHNLFWKALVDGHDGLCELRVWVCLDLLNLYNTL